MIGNDDNGYVQVEKVSLELSITSISNGKSSSTLSTDISDDTCSTVEPIVVNGGYPGLPDFDGGSNGSSPTATSIHSH